MHELRAHIQARFGQEEKSKRLLVSCLSFGFKNGVPLDADMVFDVRFLPNPHFVPEFRKLTGLDPKVAAYVRGFPQTIEFLERVKELMLYLLPHYVDEGKSYLTVAFGCTGGQHRSVMMVEEIGEAAEEGGLPGEGAAPRYAPVTCWIHEIYPASWNLCHQTPTFRRTRTFPFAHVPKMREHVNYANSTSIFFASASSNTILKSRICPALSGSGALDTDGAFPCQQASEARTDSTNPACR